MSRSTTPNKPAGTSASRPATPLRRSSRGSLHGKSTDESFPLNALEPAFAELSDAMATLEADMGDMMIMHDSLARFSESFASFLYGLNMNAFCMDFTEAPIKDSFTRFAESEPAFGSPAFDPDATFMTTDTSFVREPARTVSPTPYKTPLRRGASGGSRGGRGRGGSGIARGRGKGSRYA